MLNTTDSQHTTETVCSEHKTWSEMRESNPHLNLGKVPRCRYANSALKICPASSRSHVRVQTVAMTLTWHRRYQGDIHRLFAGMTLSLGGLLHTARCPTTSACIINDDEEHFRNTAARRTLHSP